MKLLKTAVASFLVMGTLAMAVPSSARADDWHHDRAVQHWRWEHRDQNRSEHNRFEWNRNHPYANHPYVNRPYAYGNHYYNNGYGYRGNGYYNNSLGHQNLPANGEGMINKRNPNLFWACDSDGNHCHWQPRR